MNTTDENVMDEKVSLSLAPQVSARSAELVLVNFGDFSVFLPSSDLVSLGASAQLIPQATTQKTAPSCGYLEFSHQRYMIFCFNKALQLQSSLSENHGALILLNYQECLFGISCSEVLKQNTSALTFYSVPRSMRSRKQPFIEFAVINDRAVGLSSAAALYASLRLRGAKLVPREDSPTSVIQGAG